MLEQKDLDMIRQVVKEKINSRTSRKLDAAQYG